MAITSNWPKVKSQNIFQFQIKRLLCNRDYNKVLCCQMFLVYTHFLLGYINKKYPFFLVFLLVEDRKKKVPQWFNIVQKWMSKGRYRARGKVQVIVTGSGHQGHISLKRQNQGSWLLAQGSVVLIRLFPFSCRTLKSGVCNPQLTGQI